MSNVAAAKTEFFDRLRNEPALADVEVAYAWTGRMAKRKIVYGGSARMTHDLMAFKGATTRFERDEQVVLRVHVGVRDMSSDAAAADEQATAIGVEIENLLAADPRLSEQVPGLQFAGVLSAELGEPVFDDDGVLALLTCEVGFRSFLS